MRKFQVETKEGAPFEVEAHVMTVTAEACAFVNEGGYILAVIPLANLLYVKEQK